MTDPSDGLLERACEAHYTRLECVHVLVGHHRSEVRSLIAVPLTDANFARTQRLSP
jgi:hypothetical protein